MGLEDKPIYELAEPDLESLVEGKVGERKTIDYKRELPGSSEGARKEFLADVSSFANAAGGHIVYGMEEFDGLPTALCGVTEKDPDATVSRLEGMLRDGLRPRIAAVGIQPVPLLSSRYACVIQIPRSWNAPHMVTFRGEDRFYGRNSNGKYRLDVDELRSLFSLAPTVAERVRAFRVDRLARVLSGETPVPLDSPPKVVLHVVPLGAFVPGKNYDLSGMRERSRDLAPIHSEVDDSRFNLDGFVVHGYVHETSAPAYVQLFRNGSVEAVDASLLRPQMDDRRFIPDPLFAISLVDGVGRYLAFQRDMGVEPPVVIMLSLMGVRDYRIGRVAPGTIRRVAIDRDDVVIGETVVESLTVNAAAAMRSPLDALWNAAGWKRCMNYNEAGDWSC